MIELLTPSLDASTVAGQLQWFTYGVVYGSVICSVAFMVRLFRKVAGGNTYEN
ncbi:hypothetical protein OpiT1DRAFT_04768 [Opitutaceae bacterium TAV1]|nr:hypothetical protein OpiT1DRAFT_04768 [Opitutaceae bacterium TAV1]